VHYLVENFNENSANGFLLAPGDHGLHKLLLADAAAGLGIEASYKIDTDIPAMAASIAISHYSGAFNERYERFRSGKGSLKKKVQWKPPVPPDPIREAYECLKGRNMGAAVAAERLMPYFEGFEKRLEQVREANELKYLAGATTYYGLIKDKKIRAQVRKRILSPACYLHDVFDYSIAKFNEDFFRTAYAEG
jgi:hypothetical protein